MKKLIVRFVLTYLRIFAKLSLLIDRPTVIGITGSAGKTSTREALYATLKNRYKTHVIRKGNSETGVPLGILGLKVNSIGFSSIHKSIKDWTLLLLKAPMRIFFPQKFQFVIVEMGIDDPYPPHNMEYLLSIVQPDIAVVLNAYPVHGERFEKVVSKPVTEKKLTTAIAHEKVKLVTHNPRCKVAIFNKDNESITQFLDEVDIDTIIFGDSPENHISYVDHEITTENSTFTYKVGSRRSLKINIKGYVLPAAYREVFAAAILVGQYVGMDIPDIKASLEKNFTVAPGRSSLFSGQNGSILIDSSYNASGLETLLHMAKTLKTLTSRPFVFVFGDIRELGKATKHEHERIAETLPGLVDYLYTVGPLTKKHVYKKLHKKRSFKDVNAFDTPHQAGKYLKTHLPKDALVLFKGSQNTIFLEEALKYILDDMSDSEKLPRQEDYWMRQKQFTLGNIHSRE